jgi:hypothetical protein
MAPLTVPMVSPVQGNGPHWFSLILVGVWLSGFLTALTVSFLRWRRISQIVRRALPIHEGREFEALRPVERAHKIVRPIGLLLSGDPTGDEGTSMIGISQGKTEISFDLVEGLLPAKKRSRVRNCPRSPGETNA